MLLNLHITENLSAFKKNTVISRKCAHKPCLRDNTQVSIHICVLRPHFMQLPPLTIILKLITAVNSKYPQKNYLFN